MAADLSFFVYFAPIAAYLLVFLVVALVLWKTEILGKSAWMVLFVSFFIATLFVSVVGTLNYVQVVTPWFAVLLISLFFILMITSFAGKTPEFFHKSIGFVAVIVLIAIFVVSGIVVFSGPLGPYLPGANYNGNGFTDMIYSGPVVGAVLLIVIAAIVSRFLVKMK